MEQNYKPSLYTSPYDCCGCTACASACPVKAIQMEPNKEGFLYPSVDESVCIGCGLCERVCQEKSSLKHSEPLTIYAAKNLDMDCRMSSSSGGIFSLLALYVENNNGVVYGAGFDSEYHVCHQRAEDQEGWNQFKGSKYVQSNLGESFYLIKQDLESGRLVLFSGTPCQVEGLNRFLTGTNTDKLLTCDFVCHGVPSPQIWDEWLKLIEKRSGRQIGRVRFRDKDTAGWHAGALTIDSNEGKTILSERLVESSFYKMFIYHLILRPSCHHCQFANYQRPADFTLGDFWGVENNYSDFDDDKGISLVFCNSEKALSIWESIKEKTDNISITKEQCQQPNLLHASGEAKGRKLFWRLHKHFGLKITMKVFKLVPLSRFEMMIVKMARGFFRATGSL